MSFTKFASLEQAEVLDVKGTEQRVKTASIEKMADFHDYRTEDGYLYARIRAISSRVNKNHDGWPSVELAGGDDAWERISANRQSSEGFTVESDTDQEFGYSTFIGKPIFVDHHNSNPDKARGVIVDSKFKVLDQRTASEDSYWGKEAAENHMPPVEVELLLEVDAKSFPKLAKAIVSGDIDGFSMGCDVNMSKCSVCDNEARSPSDYCLHVKQKGAEFDHYSADGTKTSKKAYEDCYGIKFFEISAVFDPADETALAREVIAGVRHEADAPPPQSEMTKAPAAVDTLREQKICPVCGSDIESTKCDICQYVPPPDGLDNPDLSKAQHRDHGDGIAELDSPEDSSPNVPGDPLAEKPAPGDASATSYLRARNSARTTRVTDEMSWDPEITPRLAAVLEETPSEEPTEQVTKDEPTPTTATTKEGEASATPADPSAKPDKQVDVDATGGVMDDSNEQASKPDVKTQVDGKGGITDASNEQASKPDEKQDVSETADDNAGFDKSKTTDDSGKTKTFPKGKKDIDSGSPHDDKAFTGASVTEAAKQGTDPVDPAGKADKRVDVEDSSQFKTKGTDTDQWTGTDGNGVTKQQPPVTPKVGPGNDVKSSSLFRAMKLADTEVKLGLTTEDDKFNRVAELAELEEGEFKAAASVVARVKTAGLAKRQARTAHSLPSLQSKPEPQQKEASTDEVPDEAVFWNN